MIKINIDNSVAEFLNAVIDPLRNEATLHSFILSVAAGRMAAGKSIALGVRGLNEQGTLRVAGLQTDPRHVLILSNGVPSDMAPFAKQLAIQFEQRGLYLPGVNGPSPVVDEFARVWAKSTNSSYRLEKELRLFELQYLIAPPRASGFARPANLSDVKVIRDWFRKFQEEAVPNDPKPSDEELDRDIQAAIFKEEYFVWEDNGACVSWVGSRRETATERWIAPVFTPKELRGQGYGAALTAYVSEQILKTGKKGLLFTDLANPTSNRIYQKIGYKAVSDFKNYLFDLSPQGIANINPNHEV